MNFKFVFLIAAICVQTALSDESVVNPSLLKQLKIKSHVDVMVSLKAGISKAKSVILSKSFDNEVNPRAAKATALHSALISNAEESQKEIKNLLATKRFSYKSFWITNKIFIENADMALVEHLSNHSSINHIREPVVSKLIAQKGTQFSVNKAAPMEIQWGVQKIRAHDHWNSGFQGQGVVVGVIDSGVRGTHQILKGNFRGPFGWLDPYGPSKEPIDDQGHETHCAGTIVGQEGYGVAPKAKWIACIGCPQGACPEQYTVTCAQFLFCSTEVNGENGNCSMAPHIVSNSWGGQGGDDFFEDVINVWHWSGIIPVFAGENDGPNCTTIGSPGDGDVITVGATDINDKLAFFSSKGPTLTGVIKPEITAPGVNITSAGHLSDNAFVYMQGTNMATPHVSGVIALLFSQYKHLNYKQIQYALYGTAVTSTLNVDPNVQHACGNIPENIFPNNAFGYGRMDVVTAA